jgi:hypothetical protein
MTAVQALISLSQQSDEERQRAMDGWRALAGDPHADRAQAQMALWAQCSAARQQAEQQERQQAMDTFTASMGGDEHVNRLPTLMGPQRLKHLPALRPRMQLP